VRAVVRCRGAALLLALGGCSGTEDATDEAPDALRPAMNARTVYPAKREEWRTDITPHTDSTMVPRVFRASRTTVALLQDAPARISQFELHGKGMLLSTRPARVDSVLHAEVPRDIVAPTDLSRVTNDGQVDVVDSRAVCSRRSRLRRTPPMTRSRAGIASSAKRARACASAVATCGGVCSSPSATCSS